MHDLGGSTVHYTRKRTSFVFVVWAIIILAFFFFVWWTVPEIELAFFGLKFDIRAFLTASVAFMPVARYTK
jgi:hypothetical protein